jgi:myo-inositol-1(or 4)-monophosphatase
MGETGGVRTPAADAAALLDLAVDTALRAGDLLVRGRPADLRVAATKSSPTDVVTEMDRASERLIIDSLLAARPDDGVLGEEGAARPGGSGVRWIVDPIDGTVNYLYDLPGWAVSIAAEVDGEVVAGVVAVPSQREVFTAVRGKGAWLDGRPISCAAAVPLDRALVATGFGYEVGRRAHQAEVLRGVLPRVRDIRRGGSCALDLCGVACGRLDGYYEGGPNAWDFAAGGLIAREAGARVEGIDDGGALRYASELIVAAAPDLFPALRELLDESGAGGPAGGPAD